MDFPKNVPGVGLVGDRFIDENPVTGQQGSLIASAWGNQVTDEILSVMAAARKVSSNPDELEPSEDKSDQLLTAIQTLIVDSIPESLSGWGDIDDKPVAINAINNLITINTTCTLTNDQLGLILIDASASDVAIALPPSNDINQGARVRLFRLDNSTNKVTIKASTGETIFFNTHLNTLGYGFFYLFGAGDFWEIMSAGQSRWIKTSSLNASSIGTVFYHSAATTPSGGFLIPNGTLVSRTAYPWLWDYAQQSGMLVDEASRTGFEGCFTTGDGSTTFRIPDLRGMFLRSFDSGGGVDISRVSGTSQGDAIRNITGSLTIDWAVITSSSGVFSVGGVYPVSVGGASSGNQARTANFSVSNVVPTASENRPKNISLPIFIKII